jgi:DNA-binding CsgD family transcriptional regulator
MTSSRLGTTWSLAAVFSTSSAGYPDGVVAQLDKVESARAALENAVEKVSGANLADSLALVARKIPVAASVEKVAIRLRDVDGEGVLHVAAVEGTPSSERLALVFSTQTIAHARSIFALGHRHSYGQALGLRWLHGEWLKDGSEPIGTITVGSRTERRPNESELALLASVATALSKRLKPVDRRAASLDELARRVARESVLTVQDAPKRVRNLLRPRELVILSLYVEGLSAQEIADLFVISAHTVRTHIKNAYRRLGVHSREEAEALIRTHRVLELV